MVLKKRLSGRVALITGASRGIGEAVAKKLAIDEGAHVILCGRTIGALEEIYDFILSSGGEATIVPFDLKEYNKIKELSSVIANRFGKLDILVGNAALHIFLSPLPHIDDKDWEESISVNLNANFYLIKNFDALLRQSSHGRALFVSSSMVENSKPYWGSYLVGKAALEKLVEIYALEVENTPVRINILSLDAVSTGTRTIFMPGENPDSVATPEDVAGAFIEPLLPDYKGNGKILKVNI